MKKQMIIAIIVLCVVFSGIFILLSQRKSIETNYGLYNVNLSLDNQEYDVDSVVPDKEELLSNLKSDGFTIETYDKILESGSIGEQIVVTKGKDFIDICYGLTEEDAELVLKDYEAKYLSEKFYVLARNVNYVYCISSKKMFKECGFEELSNIGVLYICE